MKKHLHAPLQLMSPGQLFPSELMQIDLVGPFQSHIYKYAFCDIDIFQLRFYCALSVSTCWNSSKRLGHILF